MYKPLDAKALGRASYFNYHSGCEMQKERLPRRLQSLADMAKKHIGEDAANEHKSAVADSDR